MSDFKKCIDDGVGKIDTQEANEIKALFDELDQQYKGNMASAPAAARAAVDTMKAIRRQKFQKRRQKILYAKTWQEILNILDTHRNVFGQLDPFDAAVGIFGHVRDQKFSSVEARGKAIEGLAFSQMDQILKTFKRNLIGGTPKKAQLEDIINEGFGESTGNQSAREMAEAWKRVNQQLVKRFNQAGGDIALLDNWGFPQIHRANKFRKVTKDVWKQRVMGDSVVQDGMLDIENMIDAETGLPFSPGRLDEALDKMYDNVVGEGYNIPTGKTLKGRSMANRRQDHRFLKFKNPDAWMKYQEMFGEENIFDTMMGHIKTMSRDIAMMEVLGPNPRLTTDAIKVELGKKSRAVNEEKKRESWLSKETRANFEIENLYRSHTGEYDAPIGGFLPNLLAGTRNMLIASQLGSTFWTAMTDLNSQALARKMNGLPQVKTLHQVLRHMNPLKMKERGALATRQGLIADGWIQMASAQMRYVGEVSGPEITRRISDGILRVTLLSPWTQANRWAFGQEFLGTMADNAGKRFDDLPKYSKESLEKYGFDAADWALIRKTPLMKEQGATFFSVQNLIQRTDIAPEVAQKYATRILEMINTETEFAVPTGSLRSKLWLTGGTKRGSAVGEIIRSFAMYKNFSVTIMNTHVTRAAQQVAKGRLGYATQFLIGGSILAAFGMQMKELAKGKDPRPMDNPKFWQEAMLYSGGLGIYGDFLSSATTEKYGQDISTTIAGPVVGLGSDVGRKIVKPLMDMAQGEDTKMASDLVDFTKRYTPGGNAWFLRMALERGVWDQLQEMTHPNIHRKWRNLDRKNFRDNGNQHWWPRGEFPERAPSFENLTR